MSNIYKKTVSEYGTSGQMKMVILVRYTASSGESWQGADGKTVDQLMKVINTLKENPDSRRMIINAWNVGELDKMALTPCHCMFQFYVADGKLSCQLFQRSADCFLGVPFNIASYALFTMMIAQVCNLEVGEFVHTFGDAHIYKDHLSKRNYSSVEI